MDQLCTILLNIPSPVLLRLRAANSTDLHVMSEEEHTTSNTTGRTAAGGRASKNAIARKVAVVAMQNATSEIGSSLVTIAT
jgi:hypothetical protein